MEIRINALTTDIFLELFTSVGWEPPCREQVKTALENSMVTFAALDEGKLMPSRYRSYTRLYELCAQQNFWEKKNI